MKTDMNRALALSLVVVLLSGTSGLPSVYAQNDQDAEDNPEWLDEPVPYAPEEFPEWTRHLRRGEIIALGAFPVAMIISGVGYQIGRFAYQSIDAGAVQPEYAPGFFSPQSGPRYDQSERIGLILSGAVISAGVAVADYLLGRREERRNTQ
jgi:hypothetical protein